MKLGGFVKHSRLFVEKLRESLEMAPKETKYIANFQIRLAKGILNHSEYKSFVASIERAINALDPDTPMEMSMEPRVISETQSQIETFIGSALEKQDALERDLMAAAQAPKPKLVEG